MRGSSCGGEKLKLYTVQNNNLPKRQKCQSKVQESTLLPDTELYWDEVVFFYSAVTVVSCILTSLLFLLFYFFLGRMDYKYKSKIRATINNASCAPVPYLMVIPSRF